MRWNPYHLIPLLLLLAAVGPAHAQEAPPADPLVVTAFQEVNIRGGPGTTFQGVAILQPGSPVRIVERTRLGNWVRVERRGDGGALLLDGWVNLGYINPNPALRLSQVPVSATVTDGDPNAYGDALLRRLHETPVLPILGETAREVFLRGQSLGIRAEVVTKVGDSVIANPAYLEPLAAVDIDLGPYDFLAETAAYFGPSLAGGSRAAQLGFNTYAVADPMWANKEVCQPDETPLLCEYRLKQPAVAVIVFGANDVLHLAPEEYDARLREIVARTVERGIIPLLSTFSSHPDSERWPKSLAFNAIILTVAADTGSPVMNLFLAARATPDYGLDIDGIHMKNSGVESIDFSGRQEYWYGASLQNLVTLGALDEIRRALGLPLAEPLPTPTLAG